MIKVYSLKKKNIKYIIYGLSYALLDLIEKSSFSFKKAIIIETGGMKGKRKEISKKELHKLFASGFGTKKIKARFICVLTIFWPNGKFIISSGKIEGRISNSKRGKNGFGYDPIFIPLNKKITFGQMNPKEKYKIDHRIKAFKKIKKFF